MSNETSATLVGKLAEVQQAVSTIAKRGRNDFHKYDYATEADILKAVRDELSKRKVMLIPSTVDVLTRETTTAKGNTTAITTAMMRFTWHDGDSGEQITVSWAGQGEDPADKGLYKAQTGAEKYIILKTFLIPTGDDPEGDSATDERASRPASGATTRASGSSRSGSSSGQSGERTATPKQCGLINARAGEEGLNEDQLKALLTETANVDEVKKVPMRLVDTVLQKIKDGA